jgi:hypothetical protein
MRLRQVRASRTTQIGELVGESAPVITEGRRADFNTAAASGALQAAYDRQVARHRGCLSWDLRT